MTMPDLSSFESLSKLLFAVALQPVQGQRFQPTGFPDLGAASFELPDGVTYLLVESAQSMANRLESVVWDDAVDHLKPELRGISYVRVEQGGVYLTSTVEEAHRLNSAYVEKADGGAFHKKLKGEIGYDEKKPVDRHRFAEAVARYDLGSLLHGVFLESIGGRLRIARALSSFIEAENASLAASGGVKNDHVKPTGEAKEGFGNVPFSRDEYTAKKITAYFNLDLAQIRGYGLDPSATRLLILLALYKIRAFLDGDLRLRTACDFTVVGDASLAATNLPAFVLPSLEALVAELPAAIIACHAGMAGVTTVQFAA